MPGLRDGVAVELAADLLRQGRPVELVVGGSSMWPLVRDGDTLRLEPGRPIAVGSLGAVRTRGHLVVHRIVGRDGDAIVLKGDNRGPPERFPAAEVLGVATRQKLRNGGDLQLEGIAGRIAGRLVAEVSRRTDLPWRVLAFVAVRARRRVSA